MYGYPVESESRDRFYFAEYKQDYNFRNYMDYAINRFDKNNNIFTVEYALKLDMVQHKDSNFPIRNNPFQKISVKVASNRWEDDSYDF